MVSKTNKKKVVILGGGVAGLSAAHHLLTKGNGIFDVEIYERRFLGGKARSGEEDKLPTEHGFRFFPGFYKHVTETMKEIPLKDGKHVYDNLVDTDVYAFLFSRKNGRLDVPINIGSWLRKLQFKKIRALIEKLRNQIHVSSLDVTKEGQKKFIGTLFEIFTTCNARIESTYDNVSWSDFIGASRAVQDHYGADYENLLATGISKNLVAVRADVANSRTAGKLIGHMIWHIVAPKVAHADKILNAPTNIAWINPWVEFLKEKGLKIFIDRRVVSVEFNPDSKEITGMRHDDVEAIHRTDKIDAIDRDWKYYEDEAVIRKLPLVKADYFICAMPIERADEVLQRSHYGNTKLKDIDRNLGEFQPLWEDTDWMTGIVFYFDAEIPLPRGHITVADEPAAVTMISQLPFWDSYLKNDPDKSVKWNKSIKTVLSVIVSNWDAKARYIDEPAKGKKLKNLSQDEVVAEITQILFRCEDDKGRKMIFFRNNLVRAILDASIVKYDPNLANPRYSHIEGNYKLYNKEPLFINKTHSYHLRPTGYTRFKNFFLAGDYIKTNADLGCMDSADEAARRAVNNIFITEKLPAPCKIDNYGLPTFFGLFATARILDFRNYQKGLKYERGLIRQIIEWYYFKAVQISKQRTGSGVKGALIIGLAILFFATCLVNEIYKFFLKVHYVKEV